MYCLDFFIFNINYMQKLNVIIILLVFADHDLGIITITLFFTQ